MPACTFKRSQSKVRIQRMERALKDASLDIPALAEATFASIPVTQRFVTYLHQQGKIHISGWSLKMSSDRPFGYVSPMYSWGNDVDVIPQVV